MTYKNPFKYSKIGTLSQNTLGKIKSAFLPKSGIATILVCAGIAASALALSTHLSQAKEKVDQIDDDPFFSGSDMIAEMDQMQKRMDKMFDDNRKYLNQVLAETKKQNKELAKSGKNKSGQNWSKVTMKQDDTSSIYELSFSGFNKNNIEVSVKNNILTFTAKQEEKDKNKKQESYFDNSFYYSFAIPDFQGNPEIVREDGKVTVKLAKVKDDAKDKDDKTKDDSKKAK